MHPSFQTARITCIIHTALVKGLLGRLTELGITEAYSNYGRMVNLTDARGIWSLFRSLELLNEQVDVISFYVPVHCESAILSEIIKQCRLDIPGRGSVYSEIFDCVENTRTREFHPDLAVPGIAVIQPAYRNLVAIKCIVSKGEADDLARTLLHIGVVPTVTYATGSGIRDRLGLLRITIPNEKETITVVVGSQESDLIMDKIIEYAKLDRPGRGFIVQSPIHQGRINFKTSTRSTGHAASIEQIIAAIDKLEGNFDWRQGLTGIELRRKRTFLEGSEVLIEIDSGHTHELSKKLMEIGITGITIYSPKVLELHPRPDQRVSSARDSLSITLPEAEVRSAYEVCRKNGVFGELNGNFLVKPGSRGFTYRRKKT